MSKPDEIYRYVTSKVEAYPHLDPGNSKAEIAKLRRGAGKTLQDTSEVWGVILQTLPEDLMGKSNLPSRSEKVIFLTLTLFGEAQQGHDIQTDLQTEKHVSLGGALGKMVALEKGPDRDSANERIGSRLKRVISSNSLEDASVPLRSLISLLRQKGVKLDYGELAKDLYSFSYLQSRNSIGLKWARDYYRELNRTAGSGELSQKEKGE